MRVDEIGESPILSLIDRIFRMRQEGQEVLGLHIGEPDFDTPAGIREAACRAMNEGWTHYVSAQGLPQLRSAIAQRLVTRHRIPSSAERVVILPAKFAIYATLLASVDPGDEVLLPDPTYLFEQPVRLAGAIPKYFPLKEDFSLDVDALARAITGRSKLLMLVTPSNPTGHVLRPEEIRAALDLARRHHLSVVSDETYSSLVYDGEHVAPASLADDGVPVVTIGSFSKIYSMTGWRAGFADAPPRIRDRLVKVVEHTLTCLPPFIQRACLWALANAQPDEDRGRAIFRQRRDHLLRRLGEVRGLEFTRPDGAFYLFPKYDLPWKSIELATRLLEEERLALVPGIAFGSRGEHHLRISYSSSIPQLDDGVDRLARFLSRHRDRPSGRASGPA